MYQINGYHVREIQFQEYKEEILRLRQKVWEQTDAEHMKQLFTKGFYDEHDDCAFHWGIFDESHRLIASARLSKHGSLETLPDQHLFTGVNGLHVDFPLGSLNRLVVDKNYQGGGISRLLDEVRLKKAIEIGCEAICSMTYGKRGQKLSKDGFEVFDLLAIRKDFNTAKENARLLPPMFYYKRIGSIGYK